MWLTEIFSESSLLWEEGAHGPCVWPDLNHTVRVNASAAAWLQASSENQWHSVASSQHQGHPWHTAGTQTQSLCISSAEDAPRDGISVRAWTGERNHSFTDYFLREIHNTVSHQNSCFSPFVGLLEIHQNLQMRYVTFGETREKHVILVSISTTEHGKG